MTILVLTGAPGIGKTTAVIHAARSLRDRGLKVGGIVSRELRINNKTIGFKFVDLITNETNFLASITGNSPKVEKYFANLASCRFAAERLSSAVICDEISPMELQSIEFIHSVKNLLDVDKKVIVVHTKS